MAGRYYLSPIIGSGAEGDSYRPLLADILLANKIYSGYSCSIPTDDKGLPVYTTALVYSIDHPALTENPDIWALPDKEACWTELNKYERRAHEEEITDKFGLTLIPDPGDTCYTVVDELGKTLDGQNFTPGKLWVDV
jgi:hypothetical protein